MPRKAKTLAEIESLARSYAPEAIKTLAHIMMQPNASDEARAKAANALLDRGYGRPNQPTTNESTVYVAELPEVIPTASEWQKRHTIQ